MSKILNDVPTGFIPYQVSKDFSAPVFQEKKKKQDQIISDFGHDLLLAVNSQQKDATIFISPLSVNVALLMAASGSNDRTLADFVKTLHLGDITSSDSILKFEGTLTDGYKRENAIPLYKLANSLWISDKFEIYKSYIDSVKNSFNSKVEVANFSASKTVTDINTWISEETNGLIKKMIQTIDGREVMFLINTVYFKQKWAIVFKPDKSKEGNFTLLNGAVKRSMFMHSSEKYAYFSAGDVSAALLRFELKQASLLILLPKAKGDQALLDVANKYLTHQGVVGILSGTKSQKLNLALPRFKLSYSISLKNTLKAMGLESAFSDSANFSFISKTQIKISDVIHQSVLRIDENGVEAAAATVVRMKLLMGCVENLDMPIPFVVDRPFVCALLNNEMTFFSGIIREVEGNIASSGASSSSSDPPV